MQEPEQRMGWTVVGIVVPFLAESRNLSFLRSVHCGSYTVRTGVFFSKVKAASA